jgi:hypothetical protein
MTYSFGVSYHCIGFVAEVAVVWCGGHNNNNNTRWLRGAWALPRGVCGQVNHSPIPESIKCPWWHTSLYFSTSLIHLRPPCILYNHGYIAHKRLDLKGGVINKFKRGLGNTTRDIFGKRAVSAGKEGETPLRSVITFVSKSMFFLICWAIMIRRCAPHFFPWVRAWVSY